MELIIIHLGQLLLVLALVDTLLAAVAVVHLALVTHQPTQVSVEQVVVDVVVLQIQAQLQITLPLLELLTLAVAAVVLVMITAETMQTLMAQQAAQVLS
jgi:hypothetical protein